MSRLTRWLIICLVLVTAITFAPTSAFKAQSGITVTTKSQVNLRSGPGTTFASVALIPNQTVLPAVGRDDKTTWIHVNFNGMDGWISAGFLMSTGDLTRLPVHSVPAPAAFPAPTIPLYDDFAGPSLNPDKWSEQGNNYVQNIDNHTLYFNTSWYLILHVKTDRLMRAISVLFTMEQPNLGNSGLNLTIVGSHMYTVAMNRCKNVGINEIVPNNNWINGRGRNLNESDCPSTHLLGISVDGSRARFYLDGKQIDARPWTGYIQQAWIGGWARADLAAGPTDQPNFNDPSFKPTIGRAHSVWIDFVP